jgi:lipopolysaccharide/colanic/teichoic acid biosynthesis glycosyltransferase
VDAGEDARPLVPDAEEAVGVRISVLPRLLEVVGSSVEFDDLHGVMVMGVRRFELTRSSAAVKRAFDLIGASLGLLALAPLLIAIAVAIKLDGRGPLFFRQPRVGRHGKHFDMLKFRTMVPDADALKDSLRDRNEAQEGLFKIADDPRVTRVGRLLRRSALDELPQLLNIIRGEMSLVGPRPLADRRGPAESRAVLPPPPGAQAGHDRPVAILGPARSPARDGRDRLPVRRQLVALWATSRSLPRTVPRLGRRGLTSGRCVAARGHPADGDDHHSHEEPCEHSSDKRMSIGSNG